MTDEALFTVAGTNLREFVERWIAEIEAADPQDYPALGASRDPGDRNRSLSGAAYVMQRIAPRCWGAAGGREELLLLAVMGSNDRWSHVSDDAPWPGIPEYVRRAFVHFHQLGEREVARRLRQQVARRAGDGESSADAYRRLFGGELFDSPRSMAEHERTLAAGDQRDLRVAEALDPGGDPWEAFLSDAAGGR